MPALKLNVKQVLRAAADKFARHGFDGISMRDIAACTDGSATALHYHFGSKAELYQEACGAEYESFLYGIEHGLGQAQALDSPERLAGAMFDVWQHSNATLLLTNRDAIEARVAPERFLTALYYPKVVALIRAVHERRRGHAVDDEVAFAFAAMVFGYCSLMGIEQRSREVQEGEAFDAAAYTADKRAGLCRLARHFDSIDIGQGKGTS